MTQTPPVMVRYRLDENSRAKTAPRLLRIGAHNAGNFRLAPLQNDSRRTEWKFREKEHE